MSPGAKLAAYGLVLAAALGAGAAVGTIAGPIEVGDEPEHVQVDPAEPADAEHGTGSGH